MNVKIQGGGGGAYGNTGSCAATTSYLQHEDLDRLQQGEQIEPFFNENRDNVPSKEVVNNIDNNKAKLCNDDAKFFVITVSPSAKEQQAMGVTKAEQAQAMKDFIRSDVMQKYAEGFDKGLNSKDIEYYGKIHFERNEKGGDNLHAHVIISRKDVTNSKKLSPQTNHKQAGKGAVKSGFNRTEFFKGVEKSFDQRTGHERAVKETFEYQNAMKHGTPKEMQEQVEKAVRQEKVVARELNDKRELKQELKQEKEQKRGLSL